MSPTQTGQRSRPRCSGRKFDSERFREIRLRSTEVNRLGNNRWNVRGDLSLRGQTRPVEAAPEQCLPGLDSVAPEEFRNQTPVVVAGGSVKVKDEVRVEFEIGGK